MKISNKNFFLIFFSIFILIPISSFSLYVHGAEVKDPMISTDILAVQLGNFVDSTNDGNIPLKKNKGGYDLISFDNYGEVSRDLETNTVVYGAKVKWGFEVNAWSGLLYGNIFPFIDIENTESAIYLYSQTWVHVLLGIGARSTGYTSYSIKYFNIDYGISAKKYFDIGGYRIPYDVVDVAGSYLPHSYNGYIPTTVSIAPGLKYSGQLEVAGQTFTVPTLTSDILYVEHVDMRGGECGGYEDRYSDQGISSASVTLNLADKDIFSGTEQAIVDWFNDGKVGEMSGFSNDTITIQQSVMDLSYTTGRHDAPEISNSHTFNLPLHIQPGVSKVRGYFNLKVGSYHWYTDTGTFNLNPVITSSRIQRDLSVHVQNVFVHYDLEMTSDIFMTCQFIGELSESFLDDPNLIISDMIWDTSVWGTETVDIQLTEEEDWWTWVLIILIVAVGVYIGYKLLSKYMESKIRRPHHIIINK